MKQLGFQIEGIEEVQEKFENLPFLVQQRVVRTASVKAGEDLKWAIERNINSETGLMAASLEVLPVSYTSRRGGSLEASVFRGRGGVGNLISLAIGDMPFRFAGGLQSGLFGAAANAFGLGGFSGKRFRTVITRHGAKVGTSWKSLRYAAQAPWITKKLPTSNDAYFYPAAVELGTEHMPAQKPMRRAMGTVKHLVLWAFRNELTRLLSTMR